MRRAAAIPPLVLAAAALAPGGCGAKSNSSSKFSGPAKDVASAVDDLGSAARSRDAGKICDSLMTTDLRNKLAQLARVSHRGTTCKDQLKDSLQDTDSVDISVVPNGIKITGTTATVRVKTNLSRGTDPVDTLQMANQQGWRISRLP
jgi:hypothetical protein